MSQLLWNEQASRAQRQTPSLESVPLGLRVGQECMKGIIGSQTCQDMQPGLSTGMSVRPVWCEM